MRTISKCILCGYETHHAEEALVRSNMRRFRHEKFRVWRCETCQSLHCDPVTNLDQYYDQYPLRAQAQFDYFNQQWLGVILKRLRRAGLKKHHTLLDFGCGSGLLLKYLKLHGYENCYGYDLYVPEYNNPARLEQKYDWIISMDVIEHVSSPRQQLHDFYKMLNPEGRLSIATPRANGINLKRSEEFIHQIHTPCHIHILSEQALLNIAGREDLLSETTWRQWYQNAWPPCTSRKFIESLMKVNGNDIDSAFEQPKIMTFIKNPLLIFYALFGYFIPDRKQDYMMISFRKSKAKALKLSKL